MDSLDGESTAAAAESAGFSLVLEQIAQIREQLARLENAVAAMRLGDRREGPIPTPAAELPGRTSGQPLRSHETRPPFPDPRVVRTIIRNRQIRKQHISSKLFADPAWDMLLDLTVAYAEQTRVSITSLCVASGVPQATALRWINLLVGAGLVRRVEDVLDRRRVFVALTEEGANTMAVLFGDLERVVTPLV